MFDCRLHIDFLIFYHKEQNWNSQPLNSAHWIYIIIVGIIVVSMPSHLKFFNFALHSTNSNCTLLSWVKYSAFFLFISFYHITRIFEKQKTKWKMNEKKHWRAQTNRSSEISRKWNKNFNILKMMAVKESWKKNICVKNVKYKITTKENER